MRKLREEIRKLGAHDKACDIFILDEMHDFQATFQSFLTHLMRKRFENQEETSKLNRNPGKKRKNDKNQQKQR